MLKEFLDTIRDSEKVLDRLNIPSCKEIFINGVQGIIAMTLAERIECLVDKKYKLLKNPTS